MVRFARHIEERRSFYAGLGLLFREDDIKYLFGQIPTSGF